MAGARGRVLTYLLCLIAGVRGRVFTYPSCRTAGARGRVFTYPSCRTAGARGRVFTYPSCRTAGARGRVFTYPSCRTAGTHGSSFHSPLPADSLPIFKPTSWLGDLGDYMIITGLQTTDARSRVRMPELRDKQVPNQEVPPRSETWRTTVWGRLCTISPFANLRHGMSSNQPSRQSNSVRLPQNFCWNLSEHVSISEDTPTSPTSKLSAKSITNALYK
ncbi:unnamed protein product [Prunus armeniaca]